ncbi:hypothetical protein SLEP1_g58513 [Rubroshorea leprosula]|uniref:Uncharacterized protein n=1 Tax=Rubroshorea leprosula TaxID=152421 RepID=A0AAV5MPP8_9ROSI|nr:hypothetical protein SLEP1_g58513 [Rubroshorea leprosula]
MKFEREPRSEFAEVGGKGKYCLRFVGFSSALSVICSIQT